jgi:DNA-binding XRE family transcriptional regulator
LKNGLKRRNELDNHTSPVYFMDTMTGKELKRARKVLQMTQVELAEALELHKNTVARAERDELPILKTTEFAVKYLLVESKKRGKTK